MTINKILWEQRAQENIRNQERRREEFKISQKKKLHDLTVSRRAARTRKTRDRPHTTFWWGNLSANVYAED
jgi:hypothetical protein